MRNTQSGSCMFIRCLFRARKLNTNENDGSGDQSSRTASRLLTVTIQPHRILQSRLNNYSNFSQLPQSLPMSPSNRK